MTMLPTPVTVNVEPEMAPVPVLDASIAKTIGQEAQSKFGGDWLYAEDEYFPVDADRFEER